MRIKLDENLPVRLAGYLGHLGHDTDTIPDEGLTGADDARVWAAAQQEVGQRPFVEAVGEGLKLGRRGGRHRRTPTPLSRRYHA